MEQEPVPDGMTPPVHQRFVRPARRWYRVAAALAVVWAASLAATPFHLNGPIAAIWLVLSLVLVPIGKTLGDRIVGLLLLYAAPAVLIAWFTPFVPWLVSPAVLTGLLGSLAALWWGLGSTRRPVIRVQDWVTVGTGAVTAVVFWIPFMTGGFVRALGVLSSGFDEPAHYFMWVRVWANHGYLLFNTLQTPDYWGWRVYPQGAHAILADLGTVVTGDSRPLAQVDQSVTLFAIFVCLQAGALALVTAWGVDRLARSQSGFRRWRVVVGQIAAALLVAVGPGSVVTVQSLSFAIGLVVIIAGLALAATAARNPRLHGVLVGASLIAAAPIYPVCGLMAFLLWPLYLWTSRHFWLSNGRRRWLGGLSTLAVMALSTPTFVLLALRHIDHNWDSWGYFQVLNKGIYAGIAILLAILIALARDRLPQPVIYAAWAAAAVSVALIAESVHQWLSAGEPSYYTVKTMYLGWALSVMVVAAGFACIRRQHPSVGHRSGSWVLRVISGIAVVALVAGSLLTGLLLAGMNEHDPSRGWQPALSKEAWVIAHRDTFQPYGNAAVTVARYAARHDGVTVLAPCTGGGSITAIRWGMYLKGGMTDSELMTHSAACRATPAAPLGDLPNYLRAHPDTVVNVLATDQPTYKYAIRVKAEMRLANLRVVAPGTVSKQ